MLINNLISRILIMLSSTMNTSASGTFNAAKSTVKRLPYTLYALHV